jgi:hypothetical protein
MMNRKFRIEIRKGVLLFLVGVLLASCSAESSSESTAENVEEVSETVAEENAPVSADYINTNFGYTVEIPATWEVFRNMNSSPDEGHIDWKLPPVKSDSTNSQIRNTVGITSMRGNGTAKELMKWNIGQMGESVNVMEENYDDSYVIIRFEQDGSNYMGKSYFVTNNGMGHMITFVSTPGTFEKNLSVYEAFTSRINFE